MGRDSSFWLSPVFLLLVTPPGNFSSKDSNIPQILTKFAETSNLAFMINFECDYTEGAHASILQRLAETNMEQTPGYGKDRHCENARQIIRRVCNAPDADVHFLVGGTQTNKTVIASILRPYQGVICVETGHIAVHETGAIESTGHKVITVPGINGKITPQLIEQVYRRHFDDKGLEHCVQPGMVYISQSTEVGTVYHLNELEAISAMCRKLELPLFLDGARLGYGLAASDNDTSLADIARLCDVFYIGGPKCGLLFGEAVVILNDALKPDFRTIAKQCGSIMAKGRLLGVQFGAIMKDHLYSKICGKGTLQALKIRDALLAKGFKFVTESPTNQQFVIMTPAQFEKLSEEFALSHIAYLEDGNYSVRICTSWATKDEEVDRLIAMINEL